MRNDIPRRGSLIADSSSENSGEKPIPKTGSESADAAQTEDEQYPWEDVNKARHNRRLQTKHKPDEAVSYRENARPCPKCGKGSSELAWFYFESPRWTWQHLCGRAGWMTVCDVCQAQVDFFLEVMS